MYRTEQSNVLLQSTASPVSVTFLTVLNWWRPPHPAVQWLVVACGVCVCIYVAALRQDHGQLRLDVQQAVETIRFAAPVGR